jgi:hypothetical protein
LNGPPGVRMVRARSIHHFGASPGDRRYQPGQAHRRSGRTFCSLGLRPERITPTAPDAVAPLGAVALPLELSAESKLEGYSAMSSGAMSSPARRSRHKLMTSAQVEGGAFLPRRLGLKDARFEV